VFVDNETGEQLGKKVYYRLWDELMERTGLKNAPKKLTYYSLRHTYCTFRLMAGVDVFLLARNMGTSVKGTSKNSCFWAGKCDFRGRGAFFRILRGALSRSRGWVALAKG
jgi:hypothetical protein